MTASAIHQEKLSLRTIFVTWWPLAASWLLMGAELPVLSAVVARLPEPEINLAAYGGVVFPLALIIESPIIMLLAASTALSKDWLSYRKIWRFMMLAGAGLTILHLLLAFTPLYYLVVKVIIGAPQEIIEPARIGLMIMTPWTWAIAYRRFNQGVLIRFGHSQTVGIGTVIRLAADVLVLGIGYLLGSQPGIVVATCAVSAGVVSEALYSGIVVRPVLREQMMPALATEQPLTLASFLAFYMPLVMTSLLTMLAQPIGSAALSRMPLALESLAIWPVVGGLIFMLRSLGMAYNEVVVTLLDRPASLESLRRFTIWLALISSLCLMLMAATPLSTFWFEQFSGLSRELTRLARVGLWVALPLPALAVLQSWFQGAILHGRRTRGITEAVVIYLVSIGLLFWLGVLWSGLPGLYVGLGGMGLSMLVQTAWLWQRSQPVMQSVLTREAQTFASRAAGVSLD